MANVSELESPVNSSQALQRLLRSFSVEVTASDKNGLQSLGRLLPPQNEVFISYLPKDTPSAIVEAAVRVRQQGQMPVPHIVARHIASASALRSLLTDLAAEAGVDRVLVLGGDRDDPAGDYASGQALLESGQFEAILLRRVYFPHYPEGHSRIADAALDSARQAKLAWAQRAGIEACLVSQFCFEPAPLIESIHRLRRSGVRAPYRVGVTGVSSRATLLKFALACGVGPSLRVLREHGNLGRQMLSADMPDAVLRDVAVAQSQNPGLGIAGVHFFTFGSLAKTVDWVHRARDAGRD